ncbi:MAG: glycosyltransferase family 4 protein [Clostridiales bacterium]|nr:glycosyltransferase family 4 protein [Clostridiales bacterium]
MKKIWIINHYATEMLFKRGGRHYVFAKYLKCAGYEPVIFGCNAKHNSDRERYIEFDKLWQEQIIEEIQVPFVFVKSRVYKGNGKQRVLNMVDFYLNVKKAAKEYAELHGKPDVIYASSVHPLTLVAGIQLAKHYNVKCICEIRDLWPESLVAYEIVGPKNPAVLLLRKLEKWIYKHADSIVFTMEGAYDYIKNKGWEKNIPREKVFLINNGVDLETYEYNLKNHRILDADLDNPFLFKVIYTGSIRKANKIDLLVEAAKKLRGEPIRILVWGSGDQLEQLEDIKSKERIDNIVFKGSVQKDCIPYILSKSNTLFLDPFDESVSKYGISSNKLFEYLAAGKPVLMNQIPKYNPAAKYGCDIVYDMSADSIAKAIKKVYSFDEKTYQSICSRAGLAATEYAYSTLTQKIIDILHKG